MMNVYIGENVRRLRGERGLTQEELADFLGVTFQAVSKWERGLAYPDVETIPVIANYFGVTIDELMGNSRIRAEERITAYLEEYERLTML
ncbi:MAG: helix-turn-helix transcriptional regulator, partial [Clostridia bacterium]|nr:helix-turn-helix transcriptional regulator [Clostridia bacterium]